MKSTKAPKRKRRTPKERLLDAKVQLQKLLDKPGCEDRDLVRAVLNTFPAAMQKGPEAQLVAAELAETLMWSASWLKSQSASQPSRMPNTGH
jgi:hypothetical protein